MKNRETIPIVFCVNDSYIPQLATVIVSILKNSNKKLYFEFHIINSKISNENEKKLLELKKFNRNIVFNFINLSEKSQELEKYMAYRDNYRYITVETYYRFFIPSLLPQYNKVLYLDADILVLKDISVLYYENISNYYLAAVQDAWSTWHFSNRTKTSLYQDLTFEEYFQQKLQIVNGKYFNAGVLLLNLDKIREDSKEKELLQFADQESPLEFQDQDVFNAVFKNKVKFVDCCWNKLGKFYEENSNVRIYHFVGPDKPWFTSNNNLRIFLKKWWKYYLMTPFFNKKSDRLKMNTILSSYVSENKKNLLTSILWRLIPRRLKSGIKYKIRNIFVPDINAAADNTVDNISRILDDKLEWLNQKQNSLLENMEELNGKHAKLEWKFDVVDIKLDSIGFKLQDININSASPANQKDKQIPEKIRVGLLIDEFFGGAGTAYGGYGFLARKFIAKYIPCDNIEMDVLLSFNENITQVTAEKIDDIMVYKFPKYDEKKYPRDDKIAREWLIAQNYDIFLSIEMTWDSYELMRLIPDKKIIVYIQDPRPRTAMVRSIDTLQSIKDPCNYIKESAMLVNWLNLKNRAIFISQGYGLNPLAIELYNLPANTIIHYLPNPIEIDYNYEFDLQRKTKKIIFLGRLEAQKRVWLVCEIAKRMPEYDFYVLGKYFRHKEDNERMLSSYKEGIDNLYFVGHVDGEEKENLIKEARILVNTSIWEGIPISWLECLQYGTLPVSCLDRDNLVSRFGKFTGEIPGDGFEGVDKFIPAIRELMEDDVLFTEKARDAIGYIQKTHSIDRFKINLRRILFENVN